ncbi:hypothetical protein KA517_04775, partial [Candidatus Gracilibacteria bacterium]|nr:hypothetical protein [Candidatus Gracilibacteria bacterium]
PEPKNKLGLISFKIKDNQGSTTDYSNNLAYSTENKPETLYGLLESSQNPFFQQDRNLVTNVSTPTFFGTNKTPTDLTIEVASDDPRQYQVSTDKQGHWSLETTANLAEGPHHFSVKNPEGGTVASYNFAVDQTAPQLPSVKYASWGEIKGISEPYAYIGIQTRGQQPNSYFIQADSSGQFVLATNSWNTGYLIAAADAAGNVSPLVQFDESQWQNSNQISLWQKLRPYLLWTLLIAGAATGLTYARKSKVTR